MNARALLLDSLRGRWRAYKTDLKHCRRGFSEANVHDFRIATRRLLAFLTLLYDVGCIPRIKRIRRHLKDQLENLDALRDVQVLLADISGTICETPVLAPFQEYLKKKEKKLLRSSRNEVKTLRTFALGRQMQKVNKAVGKFEQASLVQDIFSAVDEAYAVVQQRSALIDPSQPATIHELRIAFKKFRYMLEAIHPLLPEYPAEELKRMRDFQSTMGNIQDMEVALRELAEFSTRNPVACNLRTVFSYYEERRALSIARFVEDRGNAGAFWRPAPDRPFAHKK